MKRHTLIGPIQTGGLNIIDIKCHFKALKATWISQILNSGQQAWAFLGRHYLSKF